MRWLRRHRGVAAGVVLSVATAIGVYYGLGPSGPSLSPTYKAIVGDSSTANLPTAITINAQTISPTYRYYAQDCDATECTASVGDDLPLTAVGADPSVELPTPFTSAADKAVGTFTADYYTALTGDWADKDGVLSLTFRATGTTNATLLHHHDGTHGYRVYVNASDQLVFEADGASALVSVVSAALTSGAWYHAELFYDASGSAQWYVNALASGSAVAVSGAGSLTAPTANLSLGSDASNHWDGQIAFAALHLQASWLDTHLQPTVAAERFYRLTGLYPQISADSTLTYARNSTAYLRNEQPGVDTTLFLVGAGWPRLEKVGGVVGYLSEPVRTNSGTYSEEIDNGVWSKSGVVITANAAVAPNGEQVADRAAVSVTTAEMYRPSANFNGGASVDGVRAAWCFYAKRVSGGTQLWVGTTDAATWTGQEQTKITLSDAWQRFCGTHTIASTVPTTTGVIVIGTNQQVLPGTDDLAPITYDIWGVEFENQVEIASSYTPTTTAFVTRSADTLTAPAVDNVGDEGSPVRLEVRHKLRFDDIDHPGDGIIWSVSDDTLGDSLMLSIEPGDVLRARSFHYTGLEGDVTGTTDVTDAAEHDIIVRVQSGKLTLYVDGNLEGTDATADVPDGLKSIDIGHAWDDLSQPLANVSGFQVNPQRNGEDKPTFHIVADGDDSSGIKNMPSVFRLLGVNYEPVLLYEGKNAGASAWTATFGSNLTQSGTAPTLTSAPLTTDADKGALFAGAQYDPPSTAYGTQGPGVDFVLELIVSNGANSIKSIAGITGAVAGKGWSVYDNGGGIIRVYLSDGVTPQYSTLATGVGAPEYNHYLVSFNRDENAYLWRNGSYVNGASISSYSAVDFTSGTTGFNFGSSGTYAGTIVYAALWQGMTLPTDRATYLDPIAKDRFLRLSGIFPQLARGTAIPTTATRASGATIDIWRSNKREIFRVGNNWMRVARREDDTVPTARELVGYLAEEARTNYFRAWSGNGGTVAPSSVSAPSDYTYLFTASGTAGVSAYEATLPSAVSDTAHHVYVKAGNTDWVALSHNGDNSTTWQWFNMTTGAAGSQTGSAATFSFLDVGDGWWWLSLVKASDMTPATWDFQVAPRDGDGSSNGSVGDTLYLSAPQIEVGSFATSWIGVTGADVTRNKDQLIYKGDDGNLGGVGDDRKGSMYAEVLLPDRTSTTTRDIMDLSDASDGGASPSYVRFYVQSDVAKSYGEELGSTGLIITGTTDILDGVAHQAYFTWNIPSTTASLEIDGTDEGTVSVASDVGHDLDRIAIGYEVLYDRYWLNGIVGNALIFPEPMPGKAFTPSWSN